MNQKAQFSFPIQFLILLGLVGTGMIVGSLLSLAIGANIFDVPMLRVPEAMNKPENAHISRILNTGATFIAFMLPVIFYAKIIGEKPFSYFGFNLNIKGRQIGLVVLITFAGMIFSGALGLLNQEIPLPESLLKKAKEMEQAYKDVMLNMAYMRNVTDYIMAVIVMALAPAVY